MVRVGIIGGGIGGLGAAYELAKQGHQVAVYERAPFLGGLAAPFDIGGGRLERFYHHLFLSDQTIIGLLEELGLDGHLIWEDSKVGFYYQGKVYRFSTPLDLLRFTPVGLIDRIRMGLVTLYLRRSKNWQKWEGITAAAFMRKWVGRAQLRGYLGADAEGQVHDVSRPGGYAVAVEQVRHAGDFPGPLVQGEAGVHPRELGRAHR